MSNTSVGGVYQQIIRDVIEASRVDFEEGGVDESVLDEMGRAWQKRLSDLKVATFPWDPKPEPPSDMSYPQHTMPPAQVPQYTMAPNPQQHFQQPMQMPQHMQPQQQQQPLISGVRIKTEPGLENPNPMPQYTGMGNLSAAQRAAANLQNSYGARAAGSINAIHTGVAQQQQQQQQQQGQPYPGQQQQQPQMQQRPVGTPIPRPSMNQPSMTPSQYQAAVFAQQRQAQQAAQQPQQQQQQQQQNQQGGYPSQQGQQNQQQQNQNQSQGPNGIVKAQVDGGADEADRHSHYGVVREMGPDGQVTEIQFEVDNMIRAQIEARAKAKEGGGLMLPMKAHKKKATGSKRERKVATGMGQTDGGDDGDSPGKAIKEEVDDDAINSDLDDTDEEKEGSDEEEETAWVMLCMYDKVQRVKNKWKCVMKDGVLTINGKDYVFHKASGEYEW